MLAAILLAISCGLIAGQFHFLFGVAPILGAILCGACFLPSRFLWRVGLGGMLLRDSFVGFDSFTFVRLMGIALVVALVIRLKVRPTLRSLLGGLFIASPVFQLTLVLGDWVTHTCAAFPRTAHGLWASIASSLPYFQRVLVADTLFTSLFLALYVLAAHLFSGGRARAFSWNG